MTKKQIRFNCNTTTADKLFKEADDKDIKLSDLLNTILEAYYSKENTENGTVLQDTK